MHLLSTFFLRYRPFLLLPILLIFVQPSCRKQDFSTTAPGQGFTTDFFTPEKPVNKTIRHCIELLKQENERRNFVDALPKNLGMPLWEKMQLRKLQTSQARGDAGEHFMVIAFAPGTYVSGLLIAVPVDTGYTTNYYSKEYLNFICHKSNKDIADAENLLGLFMLMENSIFNRTDFYHIPTDLFPTNARVPLTDSTKIASMISIPGENMQAPCVLVPSGAHHYMEEGSCDWYLNCPVCSAMYCGGNPPGPYEPPVPGGPGGPPGNPPNTPGGGGGSGGGNPPPPTPVPCDAPFYLVDPCAPTPGPLPPEEPPYFTLLDVDADSVSNPCVSALINQLSMPGLKSYLLEFYQNPSLPAPHNDKIKIKFLEDTTLAGTNGILIPGRTHLNILQDSTKEIQLTLNPKCMQSYAKEFIVTVILHELAHGIYSILDPAGTQAQQHQSILNGGALIIARSLSELFPSLLPVHATALGLSGIDDIILIPDGQGGYNINPQQNQKAIEKCGLSLEIARPIGLTYIAGTAGNPC